MMPALKIRDIVFFEPELNFDIQNDSYPKTYVVIEEVTLALTVCYKNKKMWCR